MSDDAGWVGDVQLIRQQTHGTTAKGNFQVIQVRKTCWCLHDVDQVALRDTSCMVSTNDPLPMWISEYDLWATKATVQAGTWRDRPGNVTGKGKEDGSCTSVLIQ